MNNYINLFKSDFFSGVLAVTKKVWLKVLYAYIMYYVAMLILGGLFALIALTSSVDLSFFTENIGNPNPSQQETLLFIQQFSDMIATPEFLVPMVILFVILLIMGSWNYYFAFIATNSEVKAENKTFRQLLKQSFSVEVFKLIGVTLLLNIIVWILFVVAIMSAALSPLLAFILFIAACITCMRFVLVIPAFVVGNYDFSSSFAFSFYHITWKRALKYFGISILAMLLLMGVSLLIGLVSGIFAFIPVLGIIIQSAINIVFGAIMMTVMANILVGLFYRYTETPKPTETNEVEWI